MALGFNFDIYDTPIVNIIQNKLDNIQSKPNVTSGNQQLSCVRF